MIKVSIARLMLAQGDSPGPLEPFNATLAIISGIVAVIVGFVAVDRWQDYKTKKLIRMEKLESKEAETEKQKEMITEVVAAAFTGRAEADHHFRAEALNNYKTVLREALDEHARDERRYIDGLRDKITEYHVTSLQAIQDAKRIAHQVSGEYQAILKRLRELDEEMVALRKAVADLEKHTHDQGSV